MFRNLRIKKREQGYCVLYKEDKGYYLSKAEIVQSLNLKPVEEGSKKDCEKFIIDKNNESNVEILNQLEPI